jgi:hypothetical protein
MSVPRDLKPVCGLVEGKLANADVNVVPKFRPVLSSSVTLSARCWPRESRSCDANMPE